MPHSLRAKLSGLRYKKIITDREYERLCTALDNEIEIRDLKLQVASWEQIIDDIRSEIAALPEDMGNIIDIQTGEIIGKYISSIKVLQIIDKHIKAVEE